MIQAVPALRISPAATASRGVSPTKGFALSFAAIGVGGDGINPSDADATPSVTDGAARQDAADDGTDLPNGDAPADPRFAWLTPPMAMPIAIPVPVAAAPTPSTSPSPTAPIASAVTAFSPLPAATHAPAARPAADTAGNPIVAGAQPIAPVATASAATAAPSADPAAPMPDPAPPTAAVATVLPEAGALLAMRMAALLPARAPEAIPLAPIAAGQPIREPFARPLAARAPDAIPPTIANGPAVRTPLALAAAPAPIAAANGVLSDDPIAPTPATAPPVTIPVAAVVADPEPDAPIVPLVSIPASPAADPRAVAPEPLPIALPDPSRPAAATPALQVFAGAMRAGWKQDGRPGKSDPSDPSAAIGTGLAMPLEAVRHAVAATGATQDQTLDTRREHWPSTMIDHIEALRDSADATSSRIRVAPDALGTIDLSVKRDGDTLHVHFHAEQEATRTLLADAQPRLAEIAQSRGLKLGDTNVGGSGGGGQQRAPTPAAPITPLPAPASTTIVAVADDDTRIA